MLLSFFFSVTLGLATFLYYYPKPDRVHQILVTKKKQTNLLSQFWRQHKYQMHLPEFLLLLSIYWPTTGNTQRAMRLAAVHLEPPSSRLFTQLERNLQLYTSPRVALNLFLHEFPGEASERFVDDLLQSRNAGQPLTPNAEEAVKQINVHEFLHHEKTGGFIPYIFAVSAGILLINLFLLWGYPTFVHLSHVLFTQAYLLNTKGGDFLPA